MLNVPETRQQHLLERLADGGQLIAQELADELGVSLDTIRRDIISLEQQGKAHRVRGGAVSSAPVAVPLQYRTPVNDPGISALVARALRALESAETLLLDGGTTVLALAERLQPKPGLLVITPSPWIAVACQKNGVGVFMLGGRLSPSGGINVGDSALLSTAHLYADAAVLGVCGIDHEFGLSADDDQEAKLKLAMSRAAKRTFLLATQQKLGRRARHRAIPPEGLHCLVTDATPSLTEPFHGLDMEILHA